MPWMRLLRGILCCFAKYDAGEVRVMIGQGFGRTTIRGIASVLPPSPVQTNHHNSNNKMMLPDGPNLSRGYEIWCSYTCCRHGNTNSSMYQEVVMMIPAACPNNSAVLRHKKIDAPCHYSKVGACSLLLDETLMLILYHHLVDSWRKEKKLLTWQI